MLSVSIYTNSDRSSVTGDGITTWYLKEEDVESQNVSMYKMYAEVICESSGKDIG